MNELWDTILQLGDIAMEGVSMGPMEPHGSYQSSVPKFDNTVRVEYNAEKLRQKACVMTWTSTLSSQIVDMG